MNKENNKWWKSSVIYQVYPRSFFDSNSDGIGDLQGIIKKLDYLQTLGIDAIWLSPVYKSPQDDNGYDISDYQDIDKIFGSLSDMEMLINKAKEKNIKIIMDLVLNHTSDEHKWFIEAKKSKDNPYHDFYVWRDGTKDNPPNELKSVFGGSAWEWVEQLNQYYLHQFSVKQPDLNWENPKLREEIYNMINWWIDKGIGGFRLDVIDLIGKEPDKMIMAEGKNLHNYIKEMTSKTFSRADLVTVGEAWSATVDTAKKFSNPDASELSMVFQFEHMVLDQQEGKEKWDLKDLPFIKFKEVFEKWQVGLFNKGWNSLFLSNHDLPRSVSRFGDDVKYREKSAKMLATFLHGMQGTPYIYQGEELGMTNVKFDISDYRDIETVNMYKERIDNGYEHTDIMNSIYAKGRDNARTPMQWDESDNAGFTDAKPWIKCNANYTIINAKEQLINHDSIFHYYQKLIKLRKTHKIFIDGEFELLLRNDENIFAYLRKTENEDMLVICNFTAKDVSYSIEEKWKNAKILISNYDDECEFLKLRPYEAKMLVLTKGV